MRLSTLFLLVTLLFSVLAVPLRRYDEGRKLSRWQRDVNTANQYKLVSKRYRRDNEDEDEDDDDDDEIRSRRRKRSKSRKKSGSRKRKGSKSGSRSGSRKRSRSGSRKGSRSGSRKGSKHKDNGDGMVECSLKGKRRIFRDRDVQRIVGANGEMAKVITGCVVYRKHGQTTGISYTKVFGLDPNGGAILVGAETYGDCNGGDCQSQTTGGAGVTTGKHGATIGQAGSVTHTQGDKKSDVVVGAAGAVVFGR